MKLSESGMQSLINDIKNLEIEDHNQIMDFILTDGTKFTENENGVFLQINQLKSETIERIYNLVEKSKSKLSENMELSMEDLSEDFHAVSPGNSTHIEEKHNFIEEESKQATFNIESWKIEVINKIKNEIKPKNKRIPKQSNVQLQR